ncbi:MAG TPA: TIGR03618 family F420-dependent PPOX class oxidoreductase [Candidatus Binataceae bacterium]|nr:TIGR03618 family F420-dependent PPOX class oxidoreductase [Candidatus Binataceae bacterium]
MNQRNAIKFAPEEAMAYVASRHSCALATNGKDGYPHVVAMWYTVRDGAIMMTSYARAQKIVNLRRDPRATVLVESGAKYKELRGVMMRGRVELSEGPQALREILRLTGADPANPAAVRRVQKRVLMRFKPERWASWDHSKIAGDY